MTTSRPVPSRWVRPEAVRSLRPAAIAVQVLLVAWLPFCVLLIVFGFEQRSLLARVDHYPLSVSYAEVIADQHRANGVNAAFVALLAATGVAFIVWFWRAYRNVESLGLRTRYASGWAVGAWFVPFLNFVRPKQLANDLWGAVTVARPAQAGEPGSVLLGCWWGAWLGALVALPLAADHSAHPTVDQLLKTNSIYLARAGLFIVAAVLALCVVRTITRAQQELLASAGSR